MGHLTEGVELDARVAEALGLLLLKKKGTGAIQVIGKDAAFKISAWTVIPWQDARRDLIPVPAYSTDPGEAIKALEEFCENHRMWWVLSASSLRKGERTCLIYNHEAPHAELDASLPLAICRAIVSAHGAGKK